MRTKPFRVGDRLRLNEAGLRQFPARQNVLATVTRTQSNVAVVTVLFDGFSSRESLDATLFEESPVPGVSSKEGAPCK